MPGEAFCTLGIHAIASGVIQNGTGRGATKKKHGAEDDDCLKKQANLPRIAGDTGYNGNQ